MEIDEIKTVPHVPVSHPFVERLIGTIRREFLDHVLFWNGRDLEHNLTEFQMYYNVARFHDHWRVARRQPSSVKRGDTSGSSTICAGFLIAGGWSGFPSRRDSEFETHTHAGE